MTDISEVYIVFPELDGPAAGERAFALLSELRRDIDLVPHLDRDRTKVARTEAEALDFGATLIAVLGTPAVIYLARAVYAWAERTGTVVEANGIRIENVAGRDAAEIAKALQKGGKQETSKSGRGAGALRKAKAEKTSGAKTK